MARLNFSFAETATQKNVCDNIKKALKTRPDKTVGIIFDTKGAAVRTGLFDNGKKEVEMVLDSIIKITTDYEFKGNAEAIACSYKGMCSAVKVGGNIMLSDGDFELVVTEIGEVSDHFYTIFNQYFYSFLGFCYG